MRELEFAIWLKNVYKTDKDVSLGDRSQRDVVTRCIRVNDHEGELDKNFLKDDLKRILSRLECKNSTPNHNVPIVGIPKTGTASLKTAVTHYRSFCIYAKPKI